MLEQPTTQSHLLADMQHRPVPKTVGSSTDLHGTLGSRGRKMSITGGNRSWSEEEVSP